MLLKSIYGMTNSVKLFADELTEWLLEEGFILSQCQISIYYKFAPDGKEIFVLSYVDDFVYWYTSEALVKFFVDTLEEIFHVKFLGYSHCFMSIRISHMRDHSIPVDQDIYDTSIVAEYLDTATVKPNKKLYKTTLASDIIFTKADASTSGEQVEK